MAGIRSPTHSLLPHLLSWFLARWLLDSEESNIRLRPRSPLASAPRDLKLDEGVRRSSSASMASFHLNPPNLLFPGDLGSPEVPRKPPHPKKKEAGEGTKLKKAKKKGKGGGGLTEDRRGWVC